MLQILQDSQKNKNLNFLLIGLVVTGFLTLQFLRPYFFIIFISLVAYIFLTPLHNKFVRSLKRNGLSAFICILVYILVIVIPLTLAVTVISKEISSFIKEVDLEQQIARQLEEKLGIVELSETIETVATEFDVKNIEISQFSSIARTLVSNALKTGQSFANLFTMIIIHLTLLYYLLTKDKSFRESLRKYSPFTSELNVKLATRTKNVLNNMVFSVLLIALAQALFTFLVLAVLNVPLAGILSIITLIASILPLGSGIVVIPVSLIYMLSGDYQTGLILLVFMVLVVGSIDNVLRPIVSSKGTRINTAWMLLGVVSGVAYFGFIGILVGPLILELFLTFLDEVYEHSQPQTQKIVLPKARKKKQNLA